MKDIKQIVASDIVNLMASKKLNLQEQAVVAVLMTKWGDKHVTQKQIAESPQWKEATKEFDTSDSLIDTITRRIRKHIRNLRVMHKLPILHDTTGHYLPENQDDLESFIARLEYEAKGRAASSLETYKVMKDSLGASSDLFEQMDFVGTQILISK